MPHKNKKPIIALKIKDAHGEYEKTLHPNERLSVGRALDNDIVVYDDNFAKKQTLLECKNNSGTLFLTNNITGEIRYHESRLRFQDLLVQNILPQNGEFRTLQFSPGQSGIVHVGDKEVLFKFNGASTHTSQLPDYTWKKAAKKSIFRDALFKVLILLFLGAEVYWGFFLKSVDLPPQQPPEPEKVKDRFARFVIRRPETREQMGIAVQTPQGQDASESEAAETSESESQQSQQRRRPGGGRGNQSVESVGLLGLLSGSGESQHSSQAADFLIDKGLVKELDEAMNVGTLQTGSGRSGNGAGSGNTDDELDQLLQEGLQGSMGNIDASLPENDGVERVALKKKGQVNIQQPQNIQGSEQARGERSAKSVMDVINAHYGRIMYTYNKYLRQNPSLRGKISIDVTIAASGRVSRVKVVESSIDNPNFINDILSILRRLNFERIDSGSITVNLPFVFNRAG